MSTVVTLRGPMTQAALAVACDHVDDLLRRAQEVVVEVRDCDLSVVDAVARMRLSARRHGTALAVRGADPQLFAACGLADVLPPARP